MDYILFSPVGGTDPISFKRDGGILHICRKYRPSCVMLYLSGEMLAYQQKDDRYREALKSLADECGFSLEIRSEERPGLTQVHLFDIFYQDFEKLLHNLHQGFPRHQLLVNLSSGTPAMKRALAVLAAMLDFHVLAVQVATPNQQYNGIREKLEGFDLKSSWACNLDRRPETYQDRCTESKGENLRSKLQRKALEAHLEVYDYQAARTVGEQMGELLPPEAKELLNAACQRSRQEWKSIGEDLRERIVPEAPSSEERDIFEYLLNLRNRLERGELAEYLRGLTPGLYRLSRFAVEHIAQISIADYRVKEGGDKISVSKMQQDETGRRLLNILKIKSGNHYLSTEDCCKILKAQCAEHRCVGLLQELRLVEEKARNKAAHRIDPITEKFIADECGLSARQIQGLLESAASAILGQKTLEWGSYDHMNERIRRALAEPL